MSSVTLGDVLQKVAAKCHQELRNLIDALPAQTPELRAEKILQLVANMKKRLAVLLALMKWLHDPRSNSFLNAVAGVQSEVAAGTYHWNFIQDTLYFSHAHLHSKRIRTLELPAAMDLLSRRTYGWLPQSIFTLNQPVPPPDFDENDILRRLSLSIRTKLVLVQTPHFSIRSVLDGKVTVGQKCMYSVELTLSSPEVDATWVPLSVTMLPKAHDREVFRGKYDAACVEAALLKTLRGLNEKSNFLPLMDRICTHASLGIVLRLFYVQALDLTRNIYHQLSEVQYLEQETSSQMLFRFWKNSVQDKWYAYEVRIELSRLNDISIAPVLAASLFSLKPGSKEDKSLSRAYMDEVSLQDCYEDGVAFSSVLDYAILAITRRKISFIQSLIESSMTQLDVVVRNRLIIEVADNCLKIILGNVYCDVMVELRTGIITVKSPSLTNSNGKRVIAELQHEIIQIMIPISFGDDASSISVAAISALLTFPLVIQHLLLAYCAKSMESSSLMMLNSLWCPVAVAALSRISDVSVMYEVHSWQLKNADEFGVKFHSFMLVTVSPLYEVEGYIVVMRTAVPATIAPPVVVHTKALGCIPNIDSKSFGNWLEQGSRYTDSIFSHICLHGGDCTAPLADDLQSLLATKRFNDKTIVLCGTLNQCVLLLLQGHSNVSMNDITKHCTSNHSLSFKISDILPLPTTAPSIHVIKDGVMIPCNIATLGPVMHFFHLVAKAPVDIMKCVNSNDVNGASNACWKVETHWLQHVANYQIHDDTLRVCFGPSYMATSVASTDLVVGTVQGIDDDMNVMWIFSERIGKLLSLTRFAKLYASTYKACFGSIKLSSFLELFERFLPVLYTLEVLSLRVQEADVRWSCLLIESFDSFTLRITCQSIQISMQLTASANGIELEKLSEDHQLIMLADPRDFDRTKQVIERFLFQ